MNHYFFCLLKSPEMTFSTTSENQYKEISSLGKAILCEIIYFLFLGNMDYMRGYNLPAITKSQGSVKPTLNSEIEFL